MRTYQEGTISMRKSWQSGIAVVGLASLLAGCGSGGGTSASTTNHGDGGNMTAIILGGGNYTRNFNPLSPSGSERGGSYFIFEPLMIFNGLNGKVTPWLATKYAWSNGNKTLTFTIRSGVKWTDGQPFSAQDVAFTLNLLKKFPALDGNNIWSSLSSVTASGNQVVVQFKTVNTTLLPYISQIPIVPEHLWKSVKNPVTYTNPNPVGTGPMMLKFLNTNEYVMVKNPHYWGHIGVNKLTVLGETSGQTADLWLSQGKFDWDNAFLPNVQGTYVAKNPTYNKYWYPPGPPVGLIPNDTLYPLSSPTFRKALAYAIDKQKIYKLGEYGYEPPASQTGLVLPYQQKWLDPSIASNPSYQYNYNVKKAEQLIASMGLKKDSNGYLVNPKTGKEISFTIQVPTGWIDWIADCNLIANELKPLGIKVTTITPAVGTWASDMQTGHFDLALNDVSGGPTPWYFYDQTISPSGSAPIGKTAPTNFERYVNPQVTTYLNQYSSSSNPATQLHAMYGLEKVMVQQLPIIPLVNAAWWYQYRTKNFTGWPNANHPYAIPSPYSYPDDLLVLTHLVPVK